jgi:hypothetical protein
MDLYVNIMQQTLEVVYWKVFNILVLQHKVNSIGFGYMYYGFIQFLGWDDKADELSYLGILTYSKFSSQ